MTAVALRKKWENKFPNYQTRWLAYCVDQKLNPNWQIELKESASAFGFIIWMSPIISEFKKNHPESCIGDHISDQAAFSTWIWERVAK